MRDGWDDESSAHEQVWVYKNGAVWVRYFDATSVRPGHWQAYRVVEKRTERRLPWGHKNARIGPEGVGYPSIDAAMNAAELACNSG